MAHQGVIVAIYPARQHLGRLSQAARALPGAQRVEDMHVTLCYLGERVALEPQKVLILAALMDLADHAPVRPPLELRLRGAGRFDHVNDDGTQAIYASVQCPDLHRLRAEVVAALASVGVAVDRSFPEYRPHITLGYIPSYLPTPAVRVPPMTIPAGAICLCWGDDRIELPLTAGRRRPALEAKAVMGAPSAALGHGPGGLFSNPALEGGAWRPGRPIRHATGGAAGGTGPAARAEGGYTATRGKAPSSPPSAPQGQVAYKPFASRAQQRWAFATGQPWAKRWADETDFAGLPARVARRKSKSARRRVLARLKAEGGGKGYGARAGEVISGRLVRGADGKFTAAGGDVAAEEVAPATPAKPAKPRKRRGGKPGAARLTPEERRAQRAAEREAERAANIAAAGDALLQADAPLSKNGLEALAAFAAGGTLEPDMAQALADLGVVTLGADGTPRLNADGRKVVNAAKRGDIRGAVDASFAAGEKVGIGEAGELLPGWERGENGKPRRIAEGGAELEGEAGAGAEGKPGAAPAEPKKGGGGGGGGGGDKPAPVTPGAAAARLARAGRPRAGPSGGGGGGGGGGTFAGRQGAGARPEGDKETPEQRQARRSAERQAQLEERRQRALEERAQRTADAVERAGLQPASFLALRNMAEGRMPDDGDLEAVVELAGLGLLNDRLEVSDEGRRALAALERGDVRQYFAAVQDARARLEREAIRALRQAEREARRLEREGRPDVQPVGGDEEEKAYKHGKHDQRSHGRRGPRGRAAAAAYRAARAGGASHAEARAAANDVSRSIAIRQRSANIDKQLEGHLSDKQRASLLAEQRRLNGEQDRIMGRMSAAQRTEAMSADVAPTVRGRAAPAKPAKADGDMTRAYGTDPNVSYQLQHRVVDMADLRASNLPNGAINPDYDPALQPRDRSRAASQAQIDGVARNLNPDVLVTDFHRIDAGSPIIDANGNVLSGNGRTLALQRAADLNPEQYAAYRARLRAEAERLGIDPAAIDGMANPVLVRELRGDADPVAFAREANSSGTLRMSPLEQAKVDAGLIGDRSVLRLQVREGQDIDRALRDPANKGFINEFLATVPANERANLLTRNGELNQMGLYRVKAALYTRAFPGEAGTRLAESMLESLDPDVKVVQNGISAALPSISRTTALIRSGDRSADLDLSEDFARVIDVYARIKDDPALTANTPANQLVRKYLGQSQLFDRELTGDQEALLEHLDTIARRPSAVRDMFTRWARIVEGQPPPGQSSLFGDAGGLTKRELIEALIRGETGGAQQAGMFDG